MSEHPYAEDAESAQRTQKEPQNQSIVFQEFFCVFCETFASFAYEGWLFS
jgi:hypothetical protein